MIHDFGPRVKFWTADDGRVVPIIAGAGDDVVATDDGGLDDALDTFVADDKAAATPAEPAKAAATPAEPAKAAATPAEPAKGPAPWEADLADRGLTDPKYAEYHRDVVQPYVTQLEQDRANFAKMFGEGDDGHQAATIASNVLAALDEDPLGTLIDLAKDLEVDPRQLAAALGDPQGAAPAADTPAPDDDADDEDPDKAFLAQLRQEREETAAKEAYESLIADLEKEIDGFDATKFHVAMRASGGDAHEAWDLYQTLVGQTAAGTQDEPPADTPPPVMGSGTGNTPVASTKEPTSIDEALDDWIAEDRASRARS